MSDKKIEIDVVYEAKDYWRQVFNYYFSVQNLAYNFLGYTLLGWCLLFLFFRSDLEFGDLIDVTLIAVLFTFFYLLFLSCLSFSNTKKISVKRCRFTITSENLDIKTETFRSIIEWRYFYRIKEIRKSFMLYARGGQKYLLPKRFFEQDEIINFRELLHAKFGTEAYLKKSKQNLGLK